MMRADRGDIDDLTAAARLHVRQHGGDAVEDAADVDVDHPVPLVDLERASGESGMTPALLTSTSTRPNSALAKSTKALHVSRLVTSTARKRAEPPLAVMSATSVSSRSVRRAPTTTWAPRSASRRAVASPMPLRSAGDHDDLALRCSTWDFLSTSRPRPASGCERKMRAGGCRR